jgi:hypothetical protein
MADSVENNSRKRLRALLGHEFFAPSQWKRRVALWSGGILVGIAAIAFARASDLAYAGFKRIVEFSPWLPLLITSIARTLAAASAGTEIKSS